MSGDRTQEDRVSDRPVGDRLPTRLISGPSWAGAGHVCPVCPRTSEHPGCLAASPPAPPDSRKCFACHALCRPPLPAPERPLWAADASALEGITVFRFTDEESEVQRSNLKLRPPKQGGEEVVVRVPELGRGRSRMQTHRG